MIEILVTFVLNLRWRHWEWTTRELTRETVILDELKATWRVL